MSTVLDELHAAYARGELGPPQVRLDAAAIAGMDRVRQAQVRELLAELDAVRRHNRLQLYEPAGPKHVAVHASTKRIRAVFGGNRAGKSTIGQVDSSIQAAPVALVPDHCRWIKRYDCETQGPFLQRTVVNDMKRTGEVVRQKWREWVPKELLKGGSFDRAYDKATDALPLECGCRFELLSTEMDLDKHGGHARHRIVYDEEPPEEYRTENVQRLADFGGDELFAMTPLKGLTWAYHQLWKNRGSRYVDAWTIGMRDNKNLSDEDIAFVLSQIRNEAERRQREFGVFAERGGQIYPNFLERRLTHAPTAKWIADQEIVVGIDPGLRFCGIVFCAFDRDDRCCVFAALLLRRAEAQDYAQHIWAVLDAWGIARDEPEFVIDPAARSGTLTSAESVIDVLGRHGLDATPGQNDVDAGIMEIQIRLKQGGLFHSPALTGLCDEAIEYAWDDERKDGKAVPKKGNDHRLDALRYACMHRPWEAQEAAHRIWTPYGDLAVATPPPRREPTFGPEGEMA